MGYNFNEWVLIYLEKFAKRKLKRSTYDSYVRYARHIHISKPIEDITSVDLQEVINEMSDAGLKYSTINHTAVVMRRSLRKAAQLGMCSGSLWSAIDMPSAERRSVQILTESQYNAFVRECNLGCSVYADAFMFMLNTGLRPGELIALKWDCVDFNRSCIEVRATAYNGQLQQPKSASGYRIVPLNRAAREILLRQPVGVFCFTNTFGSMINYSSMRDSFRRVMRRIGRDSGGGMHMLRHTFATRLLARGVDIKSISQLLGHADEYITMHYYLHPDFHQLHSAVETLDAL